MFNYKNMQKLNELEMSLYNYIIKNRDDVINMTIRELAGKAHVSTTTILRFCKKLDCDGFSEFKTKFKLSIEEEKLTNINNDINEVVNFLKYIEDIEKQNKLQEVFEKVRECENVIFIGSSTSGALARYGAKIFSSVGKFAIYIDDPYFPMSSQYYRNSIVFALSVSGENETIIEYISKFKSEGCPIVSITNREECTIAKISDYSLSYYVNEEKFANNNITSQIPVVYILEKIARKLI